MGTLKTHFFAGKIFFGGAAVSGYLPVAAFLMYQGTQFSIARKKQNAMVCVYEYNFYTK